MPLLLTRENFQSEVMESEIPVLIDFYADWCGPCRMIAPIIEEIAKEGHGVKVCKVNVDNQQELAGQFQIMSIPTLVLMSGGEVINKKVGMLSKSGILDLLKRSVHDI